MHQAGELRGILLVTIDRPAGSVNGLFPYPLATDKELLHSGKTVELRVAAPVVSVVFPNLTTVLDDGTTLTQQLFHLQDLRLHRFLDVIDIAAAVVPIITTRTGITDRFMTKSLRPKAP